jgi:5-formyltetrahydrofolate cyclo-ligase
MDEKQRIRELCWGRIDAAPEVRRAPGAVGRIPNFVGAEQAAERLAGHAAWQSARALKMNPDSPQLALRALAIDADKLVYMAVPKLGADKPFSMLTRARSRDVPALTVATIEGAARYGVPTALEAMGPIDMIVCGSVAVSPDGVRIGKGGGYADIEYALLAELGWVNDQTVIATTVHDLQVLDEPLPETPHDFRVDLIATPTRLIECPRGQRRPRGIIWEDLDAAKIAAIPALAARARAHSTST